MQRLYIDAPVSPRIIPTNQFVAFDMEIDALLQAPQARVQFQVDGSGLTAAVLDTGLRVTHECFRGRVLPGRNFTQEDGGDTSRVDDHNGHGTNVAGIIAAGTTDARRGIAPGANVVPLKVLPGGIDGIVDALVWVLDHRLKHNITVANLSLGFPGTNHVRDDIVAAQNPALVAVLSELRQNSVAVVVAAGNDYFNFQTEGMSVPAVLRQSFAVGAVYDASVGQRAYQSGAIAFTTTADQIAPFTQRLSIDASPDCYTDIFAPGASATSAGATSDTATSVQDGTSQAAPTVAGVILLLQQFHLRATGRLPAIDLLSDCLRSGAVWLVDVEDSNSSVDNVRNSGRRFPRVDAFRALASMHKRIQIDLVNA